jgi:hypothetical protein
MDFTREQIELVVKRKGFKWFDDTGAKNFDVNIIGIRNSSVGQSVTNLFDDRITISYKENGQWKFYSWFATTDPGKKGVLESRAQGGVARLVPGQYRGCYSIGLHQGRYQALRQVKPVKVYRDDDRNLQFNEKTITEGIYGINIHKAGINSTFVENWSEGCQVFKKSSDFDLFMSIIKKAGEIHGNAFTYTLLNSSDFINV